MKNCALCEGPIEGDDFGITPTGQFHHESPLDCIAYTEEATARRCAEIALNKPRIPGMPIEKAIREEFELDAVNPRAQALSAVYANLLARNRTQ